MKKSQLQIELESKISQMESKIESIEIETAERVQRIHDKIRHYVRVLKHEIREQKK